MPDPVRFHVCNVAKSPHLRTRRLVGEHQVRKTVRIGGLKLPQSAQPWGRAVWMNVDDVVRHQEQINTLLRSNHILLRSQHGDDIDADLLDEFVAAYTEVEAPVAEEHEVEAAPVDETTPSDDEGDENVAQSEEEVEASAEDLTAEAKSEGEVDDHTTDALDGDEDDPEDKTDEALPTEAVEGLSASLEVDDDEAEARKLVDGPVSAFKRATKEGAPSEKILRLALEIEEGGGEAHGRVSMIRELKKLIA